MDTTYTVSYGFNYTPEDTANETLPAFMYSEEYLNNVDKMFAELIDT